MLSAAALGASAVRNSELVTAVVANAVHITIGADQARGGPGLGAVDPRDVADDGIDGAAAARGIRRRRRRQHEVGEGDGIAEADGVAAEAAHQHQGQPAAETALAVSDREHEGADDQPHRAFGKARQHPAQRFVGVGFDIAGYAGHRQADQADSTDRHRFQDQPGNDGGEQCEVVPLVGVETGRDRHQIKHEPDAQRGNRLPGDFHECPFCSSPSGFFALGRFPGCTPPLPGTLARPVIALLSCRP